ncbi:MAG: hypothetical protein MMC23_005801 [Stictis urceolatum]|nr:hypothetical protein [Stictis urceolata]
MSAPVSHGRGGAANISKDDTPYADGEIIREGPVGDQGDGAFSTGRGGQGNIGSPGVKATEGAHPHDQDVVPETASRDDRHQDYHVGQTLLTNNVLQRGGEGNEVHQHDEKHTGLADKLKNKLFGGSKKSG